MTRPVFLAQFALAVVLVAMCWKLVHTARPPLESERFGATRLSRVDRSGMVLDSIDLKGRYVQPRLSPDGGSVLLTRVAPGKADVWSLTPATHTLRRLTAGTTRSAFGTWSPDGGRYYFSFDEQILQKTAAAGTTLLFLRNTPQMDWSQVTKFPDDESADGRWFVYTAKHGMLPNETYLLQKRTGLSYKLLASVAGISEARFSRDSKWIALTSNFSGRNEVYAVPIPRDPSNWPLAERDLLQVSERGGYSPEWGPNGELFYLSPDGDLLSTFWNGAAPSRARKLFRMVSVGLPDYEYRFDGYNIDREGQRFLIGLFKRK